MSLVTSTPSDTAPAPMASARQPSSAHSDALRYGRESGKLPSHLLQFSKDKKPVIVWNMTRRCNLKCVHCYAHAVEVDGTDDINTVQAKAMIDDLAGFGVPVMLFSGGEPLVRKDLVELASHATGKGMRAVISTNGTLITPQKAHELKEDGSYQRVVSEGKSVSSQRVFEEYVSTLYASLKRDEEDAKSKRLSKRVLKES